MLEVNNCARCTGKTTKVIQLMREDSNAILIVPSYVNMRKLYPREMMNRITSPENFMNGNLRGMRISKVILDEGFIYDKITLCKLYYYLGKNHIDVVAYGTV